MRGERSLAGPHLEHRGHASRGEADRTIAALIVQVGHEVHEGTRAATWMQRPRDGGGHRAVVGRQGHRSARDRGRAWARRIGEWAVRGDTEVRDIASTQSIGERERDDELEISLPTRGRNGPIRDRGGGARGRIGTGEVVLASLLPDDAPEPFGCYSVRCAARLLAGISARCQRQEDDRNSTQTTHADIVALRRFAA